MWRTPLFLVRPLDLLRLLVFRLLLLVFCRLRWRLRMRLRLWLCLPRLSRWCRVLWLTRRRSLWSGLRLFLTRGLHGTRVLRRLGRLRRAIDRWLRHRRTIIACRRLDWPVCRLVHRRLVHRRLVHWRPIRRRLIDRRLVHSRTIHRRLIHRRLIHRRLVHRRLVHRRLVHGRTIDGRLRHRGTMIPRWQFNGPIRRLIPHRLVHHRLASLGAI